MTTCGALLDEISQELHGWGSSSDRITPLTSNIAAGDSSFIVDFTFGQSVGITPGVVEIDSEQLYVVSVDQATGTCTVADGFGRGYNGTTATTHTAGAKVVSRPKFPRINLLKQVNEIIGAVFPDLFVPQTFTGTVTYPLNTYSIDPDAQFVLDAQWQDPIGNWVRCHSYALDPYDASFRLGDGAMIGRPLRIAYAVEPSTFSTEFDDFIVTGLPNSCIDVLRLGVVAKMLPGLDISRAQSTSVEQSDRSRVVPPSAGVNAAKYVMAEYQERLHNEAQSLRKRYRTRVVRTY